MNGIFTAFPQPMGSVGVVCRDPVDRLDVASDAPDPQPSSASGKTAAQSTAAQSTDATGVTLDPRDLAVLANAEE